MFGSCWALRYDYVRVMGFYTWHNLLRCKFVPVAKISNAVRIFSPAESSRVSKYTAPSFGTPERQLHIGNAQTAHRNSSHFFVDTRFLKHFKNGKRWDEKYEGLAAHEAPSANHSSFEFLDIIRSENGGCRLVFTQWQDIICDVRRTASPTPHDTLTLLREIDRPRTARTSPARHFLV